MRRLLQENMIPAPWIAFALYWVRAAVRQRRANLDESLMARLFYVVLAVIAFLFLLDKKDSIAALWILLGLYAAAFSNDFHAVTLDRYWGPNENFCSR